MQLVQGVQPCDLSVTDTGLANSWKLKTPVPAMLVITSLNPNEFVPSKWNIGNQIATIFTKFPGKIIF